MFIISEKFGNALAIYLELYDKQDNKYYDVTKKELQNNLQQFQRSNENDNL